MSLRSHLEADELKEEREEHAKYVSSQRVSQIENKKEHVIDTAGGRAEGRF